MGTRAITPTDQTRTEPNTQPVRRRRRLTSPDDQHVRYFLLRSGSTLEEPELGEELGSVREALVRSFKNNQPFLTLTAWNAVEDTTANSGNSPVIVKQPATRP
jgi:hypothetical protein